MVDLPVTPRVAIRRKKVSNEPLSIGQLIGHRKRSLVYVVPAAVLFLVFIAFPIISVTSASFTVQDAATKPGPFGNFLAVLSDPVFWLATRNMALWAVLTIVVQTVVGGVLAFLIETYAKRTKALLRTVFLIPLVTSVSVIAIIWAQIYAPSYGLLSTFLQPFGISTSSSLLGDPSTAIFALIIINIWQFTGFSMLLYIVGLAGIPGELAEAAKIDGATGFTYAWRIVVPLVRPVTNNLVLLGIIGTLQTFPLVYLATGGGPNHASEVFGTQIFRTGFVLNQSGYASALSLLCLLIAFVLTAAQLLIQRASERNDR